jgi:hypothetical protein
MDKGIESFACSGSGFMAEKKFIAEKKCARWMQIPNPEQFIGIFYLKRAHNLCSSLCFVLERYLGKDITSIQCWWW